MASFKAYGRFAGGPPIDYRTPSPPLPSEREPVTPMTPTHAEPFPYAHPARYHPKPPTDILLQNNKDIQFGYGALAGHGAFHNGAFPPAASAMDAFATIALATSPTLSQTPAFGTASPEEEAVSHTYSSGHGDHERPSKRARSEVWSPERAPLTASRPSTSHLPASNWAQSYRRTNPQNYANGYGSSQTPSTAPIANTAEDEAELLLNVSRAAFASRVNGCTIPSASQARDGPQIAEVVVQANKQPLSRTSGEVHIGHVTSNGLLSDDMSTLGAENLIKSRLSSGSGQLVAPHAEYPGSTPIPGIRTQTQGNYLTSDPADEMHLLEEARRVASPADNKPSAGVGDLAGKQNMPLMGAVGFKQDSKDLSEVQTPPAIPTSKGLDTARRLSAPQTSCVRADLTTVTRPRSHSPTLPPNPPADAAPRPTKVVFGDTDIGHSEVKGKQPVKAAKCAGCEMIPNSMGDTESDDVHWISCDGCKLWYHFACAGLTEKEVHVRKSSRAHTAIDYAGLNEGLVKTSAETPEHHYIKPMKEGTIKFLPEKFARMRPELITREFFERGDGMKEPIVIPAALNPQRKDIAAERQHTSSDANGEGPTDVDEKQVVDPWVSANFQVDYVRDEGQDGLDMVIPPNLTVRRVAELYGPDEKVEVIDVKSQGEAGPWTMKKWANYYESAEKKFIRNVISLEVSNSKLGRMIRRPEVVRRLDLVDSVWPSDLKDKGEFPPVQLYCLMSVADSYTDFHIDFGGSSVFYHILKGKKTFLFIPPKNKHLKKYEEWCLSPAQNHTFLPDQTKECYRVDLTAGDTMLIPSGWIHAVWTPEESLVIGGNFLTRLHYAMQIQVADIEKTTKVPRKFRHPHFQRILWFTAIRYIEDDPVPSEVADLLNKGESFVRDVPTWEKLEAWGDRSESGVERYHARYYSRYELDGLPHLIRFLLRTALISMGIVLEGITSDTRQRVSRAIPKGHGQPLEMMKKLALWVAWKRGNECIPDWAYPGVVPTVTLSAAAEKKLNAAAAKKAEREATHRSLPERQSQRKQAQAREEAAREEAAREEAAAKALMSNLEEPSMPDSSGKTAAFKRAPEASASLSATTPSKKKARVSTSKSTPLGPKRIACDACRKSRKACKHKITVSPAGKVLSETVSNTPVKQVPFAVEITSRARGPDENVPSSTPHVNATATVKPIASKGTTKTESSVAISGHSHSELANAISSASKKPTKFNSTPKESSAAESAPTAKAARGTACNDCRRSKRRCIHDESGNVDQAKLEKLTEKRATHGIKRRLHTADRADSPSIKKQKTELRSTEANHLSGRPDLAAKAEPDVEASVDLGTRSAPHPAATNLPVTSSLMQPHQELANGARTIQSIPGEPATARNLDRPAAEGDIAVVILQPQTDTRVRNDAEAAASEHHIKEATEDEVQLVATSPDPLNSSEESQQPSSTTLPPTAANTNRTPSSGGDSDRALASTQHGGAKCVARPNGMVTIKTSLEGRERLGSGVKPLSPPSSPLSQSSDLMATAVDRDAEEVDIVGPRLESRSRRSSTRVSKPVLHFSDEKLVGSYEPGRGTKRASMQGSSTSPDLDRDDHLYKAINGRGPSGSPSKVKVQPPQGGLGVDHRHTENEEEESLRLARELAFGLRRRSEK
ncbi:MAG: JmjC domain-containing histone demethylation protein 1 [Caeruleum heppii]|nr:MAG: JmjC domain-containing histone demethylation protein 1 [Caeruleum heppii]